MLSQLSDMFSKQNFPSISDIPFAHALKSKKICKWLAQTSLNYDLQFQY